MKGKIKKYVALVLSVQQLLCGCSATELEDRCFPMMAVVDEKDGQISFGYGFPKLSQKDNTDLEEARVNIAPVTGKTITLSGLRRSPKICCTPFCTKPANGLEPWMN